MYLRQHEKGDLMNTVLGKIDFLGKTLMHEHLTLDISKNKGDDARLDDDKSMLENLRNLKELGINTIVDVTNIGMGRDIERMAWLSKESGINVIASTGFYKAPYYPPLVYEKDIKELSDLIVREIMEGIGDTSIKAAVIGEIGSSEEQITEDEKKVFVAAAYAHNETGAPIYTHTTRGKLGVEQLKLLKQNGVDLSKVIIGHVDLNPDIDYYKRLLDYGCYIGFDTIGKNNYQSDEVRIENIVRLVDMGFGDRIIVSLDITRKSHLKEYGGYGHAYIVEKFVPALLKAGLSNRDVDRLLIENPARVLRGN